MAYNKELLEKLSKRIYVFTYMLMDMDDYHEVIRDGVPIHLSEKELTFFADVWQKDDYQERLEYDNLPKELKDRIWDAIVENSAEELEDEERDIDGLGQFIDVFPLELKLAVQELTGIVREKEEKEETEDSEEDVVDSDEDEEFEWPEPSKENTLYLPIKQIYFDQIASGEKKVEYRDIKDTTYKKYLEVDEEGNPLLYTDKVHEDEEYDIYTYNGGECALVPKDSIYYLSLAVGYAKERDTMLVKVEDFSFVPALDVDGNEVRYDWDEEKGVNKNPNGKYTLWRIAFHLGEIVELHRK